MKQPTSGSWLDPRAAAGAAIAALALWWAFRDVPFPELWRALAGADLWLAVLPSVACHWASLWVRALRWQQLAAGVGELPLAPAYRATAIRFMANNLFPLRLGELAGAWVVSREVGGSAGAWFGTIVLERAFDMAAIMSLALFLIAERVDLGSLRFLAFVPILGIAALRLWPRVFLRAGQRAAHALLPARLGTRASDLFTQIVTGLGGLRDARGVVLAALYTAVLWAFVATLPFLAAQRSLGVELGSLRADFVGALMTMVGVGVAVALPQAPGFVGVYHVACVTVLSALGVSRTQALAVGTLTHALFWVSITGLGLLALRGSRSSLRAALRGGEVAGRP